MFDIDPYRIFHEKVRLACGGQALEYSPDLTQYLISLLRGTPVVPPACPASEWKPFLNILRPHAILPLLYWKIEQLPEDSRPAGEVVQLLREVFLSRVYSTVQMER